MHSGGDGDGDGEILGPNRSARSGVSSVPRHNLWHPRNVSHPVNWSWDSASASQRANLVKTNCTNILGTYFTTTYSEGPVRRQRHARYGGTAEKLMFERVMILQHHHHHQQQRQLAPSCDENASKTIQRMRIDSKGTLPPLPGVLSSITFPRGLVVRKLKTKHFAAGRTCDCFFIGPRLFCPNRSVRRPIVRDD